MSEREIVAAAIRWHKANTTRLIVSAEKRREQQHSKQTRGYATASTATDKHHTEAKRLELAALRALAKACAKVRGQQIDDVVDVSLLQLSCVSH